VDKKWEKRTGTVTSIGKLEIELTTLSDYLGESHYVETDLSCTASGIERYWGFEVAEDVVLAFRYADVTNELLFGSNNTDLVTTEKIKEYIPVQYIPITGIMWS